MLPPSAPNDPSGLLDYEQLSIFLDVGLDEFREIFKDVVTDVPKTFGEIRDAFAAGQVDIYRSRLHSVRGMLSNVGGVGLTGALHSLELANAFPNVAPEILHADLTALWSATRTAIEKWAVDAEAAGPG